MPAQAGPTTEMAVEDNVEQDLTTVAHFFANGGNGEESEEDETVWARLTEQVSQIGPCSTCVLTPAQAPCRTEASWEDFYNKHLTQITELYNMLVEAQEESARE